MIYLQHTTLKPGYLLPLRRSVKAGREKSKKEKKRKIESPTVRGSLLRVGGWGFIANRQLDVGMVLSNGLFIYCSVEANGALLSLLFFNGDDQRPQAAVFAWKVEKLC